MAKLFKNPIQAIKGQDNTPNAGPLQSAEDAKGNASSFIYDNISSIDPRWVHVSDEIDGARWNKSFPYQLMMVERTGGGYAITEHIFTLPISPQSMTISTPFAIQANVTLGGIVVEHNAAPIRQISFVGTTGVTPLRGSAQGLGQSNLAQGIFAGTVNAFTNTVEKAKTLVGAAQNRQNLIDDADTDFLKGTGYYQFIMLQKFLESYATLKAAGKTKLRLALAIWKDQAVYLVEPTEFTVDRNAQSPFEYPYRLGFKAWKRVTLGINGPSSSEAFQPLNRDPNVFAQLLEKLQEARRVLQSMRDVLLAVQADTERLLLEPLREVVLFCKDAIGVAATAADLPASISSTFKAATLESISSLSSLSTDLENLGVKSGKSESKNGNTGSAASALSGAEEANKIFDHPEDNFELMEKIRPSELNLPPNIQAKITDEKERIRTLTRLDFEKVRDQFVEFQAQFADAVGAGSSSYDAIYNRPTITATKVPTQDDFDVLFALNQTILEMNRLAASSEIDSQQITTIDAVAGMASAAGIAFKVPVSKFAVPFPYGSTLEQLAAMYLGDANRWHEIATLNGLRQPFVDEEGFDLKLLVNGVGNQVMVADATNLFVGQPVQISSSNTSRTRRRITKIDRISAGTVILTLDGDPDLDRYGTVALASLHAYRPDTVNSQQLIYIPSDDASNEDDFKTKSIPGIDEFDQLIAVGGTDLLLTQNGDLAVTPDGDCRLATGLTNLIQRIRTALGTPKGSLLHHPEYGLGLVPGVSTADLDAKDMLATLQDMFRADPAFSGVTGVSISKAGPVVRVSMSVGITGTNQTIPLSVDIRR